MRQERGQHPDAIEWEWLAFRYEQQASYWQYRALSSERREQEVQEQLQHYLQRPQKERVVMQWRVGESCAGSSAASSDAAGQRPVQDPPPDPSSSINASPSTTASLQQPMPAEETAPSTTASLQQQQQQQQQPASVQQEQPIEEWF